MTVPSIGEPPTSPRRTTRSVLRGKSRGRRQQRAFTAVMLAGALAIPLIMVVVGCSPQPRASVAPDDAVPARFHQPWPWQATVQQSPSGRAALLVTGGGAGLQSLDWPGTYGSKVAVVGRDGSYRMLRYGQMYRQAAQDVLLSPDGRYVAGDATLEDLFARGLYAKQVTVVDLVTGEVRRYHDLPAGRPIAWSPDGAHLLLWQDAGDAETGGLLWLLNLASGGSRQLLDLQGAKVHQATFVAFSPDGRQLAMQIDQRLVVLDTVDGRSRLLADLGPRGRLGGAGAWRADDSIAVYSFTGCAEVCTDAQRNERRWRLGRLNASTGAPLPDGGFAPVIGAAVRIAGWQHDGDAVVVRYLMQVYLHHAHADEGEPTSYRNVAQVELHALHPGGGGGKLIETPAGDVWDLDVARDLLLDDRFGGSSPKPGAFPAASWFYAVATTITAVMVISIVFAGWIVRRRRNRSR